MAGIGAPLLPLPPLLLLVTMATLAAACGGGRARAPRPLPARASFIALERDFQGFRDWTAIDLPEREPQGLTHGAGRRRVFVNALPGAGRRAFAVGTIIVKDMEMAPPAGRRRLFAMVKRGGSFNAGGARGWEWFELDERAGGGVGIAWRGLAPPPGEGYGGGGAAAGANGGGACNGCHGRAASNDYVRSRALALQ